MKSQRKSKKQYFKRLQDEESEESEDINMQQQIQTVLKDLLPAYYQYRLYLINILKQANTPSEVIQKIELPSTIMEDKMKLYNIEDDPERQIGSHKQNKRKNRLNITEKVIERRRKKVAQYKQLQKKYEEQQLMKFKRNVKQSDQQVFVDEGTYSSQNQNQRGQIKGSLLLSIPEHFKKSKSKGKSSRRVKEKSKRKKKRSIDQYQENQDVFEISKESDQKLRKKNQESQEIIILNEKQELSNRLIKKPISKPIRLQRSRFEDFDEILEQESSEINLKNKVRVIDDETHSQHNGMRKNQDNFDTMTHKPKQSNYFIKSQKQKIEEQRKRAQELKNLVNDVLDNYNDSVCSEKQENEEQQPQQQNLQETYLSNVKHMLSEIVNLFTLTQCYKFKLRNKQYEIFSKLYELAGNKNINKVERISLPTIEKGIFILLKNEEKNKIVALIQDLFKKKKDISFESFGNLFKSMISDHEFKWLSIKVFEEEGMMRTVEYIKRLFLLFIEIEYFEKKLKRTIKMNSGFITLIKERMINPQQPEEFCFNYLEDYLFETNQNRVNRKKIVLYFESKFQTLKVDDFFNWAYT